MPNYLDLPVISLSDLIHYDQNASLRLCDACVQHGFFYLDLSEVRTVLHDWDEVLRLMAAYFDQPLEAKAADDRHSDTFGWVGLET